MRFSQQSYKTVVSAAQDEPPESEEERIWNLCMEYLDSTEKNAELYNTGGKVLFEYFQRSSKKNPFFLTCIALCYLEGREGVERDEEKGLALYDELLARRDLVSVRAALDLHDFYHAYGEHKKAHDFLRDFARKMPHYVLSVFLAEDYLYGAGVRKNRKKAVALLEEAAKEGSGRAKELLEEIRKGL